MARALHLRGQPMPTSSPTPSTPDRKSSPLALGESGATTLPTVEVLAYNAELRDAEGFIGDRASNRAFREILEDVRERLRIVGEDPLGDTESSEISKKELDKILIEGEPEAAGVVHGAIEGFAGELATVTGRFLRMKTWREVTRIVVGGGLRNSRVGELAIGRASVLLKAAGHAVDLVPIQHHPDHAGIIGTIHLAPSWVFSSFDAALGVDIGGSNIRVGIVSLNQDKAADFSQAGVHAMDLWRHRDESPSRADAIERLVKMLSGLMKRAAKDGLSLAPFIGVGCPGVIEGDGSIEKGAQNLPGNWESSRFNLLTILREAFPKIDDHDTLLVMHNDAVVQGLSQRPWMADVKSWGVLTIGTGLGNGAFENRDFDPAAAKAEQKAEKAKGEKAEAKGEKAKSEKKDKS